MGLDRWLSAWGLDSVTVTSGKQGVMALRAKESRPASLTAARKQRKQGRSTLGILPRANSC